MTTISPLISAKALQQLMGSSASHIILDISHDLVNHSLGREQYTAAHIPTARFTSLDKDICGQKTGTNGRHPLPPREQLVAYFRAMGVNDDTLVVCYDRSQATYSGRLWWTLRWMGHANVQVLDGGFQAWEAMGGPVTAEAPTGAMGSFTDRGPLPGVVTVTYEDIVANITSKARTVVDARSADRFRGENETIDPVGGHIPNALNRFFRLNINDAEGGIFKSKEVLAEEFAKAFPAIAASPSAFIMQCGSGVTACHNLLALEVAGISGAALYVGSWSEYSSRPEAVIVTGAV